MTEATRENCVGCGLPTSTDEYETCNACHDTADGQSALKPYDNYEISPCTRTENDAKPGQFYFEACEPHEADVWALYGHIPGKGAQAIGDFDTREHAEEAFQRITGIPFAGPREVEERVRVMHAGPKLREACEAAEQCISDFIDVYKRGCSMVVFDEAVKSLRRDALRLVRTAIAEATGRAV